MISAKTGAISERIKIKGISKSFPGTLALNRVDFDLRPGEIHALAGENGAGKSTLMHLLAGVYQPDEGEIFIEGKKVELLSPDHSQQMGISTVFQELALSTNMSVAENLFTNSQPTNRAGFIRFTQMYRKTIEVLKPFGIDIDPKAPLINYSVAVQQIVEIARAIERKAKVLILDEPTSAIGEQETEKLLDVLKMLRDNGVSIIYVSHKLDELFAVADRITVLKDGNVVSTLFTKQTHSDEIVSLMVGRELSQLYPEFARGGQAGNTLSIKDLSGKQFSKVSLHASSGEILGLFGLTGSGRSELARSVFGVDPVSAGEIFLEGEPVHFKDPMQAMKQGIAYITEDRKQDGLFLNMSVKDNTVVTCLANLSGRFFMSSEKEKALAVEYKKALGIKTSSVEQPVAGLSGGNQQKVLFAKWLARKPKVLIADEPTRGVDIGAKAEIHSLLRKLADEGAAVIMISSELPEILGMSDRIGIMREGHLVAVLDREKATEEQIGAYALGAVGKDGFRSGTTFH